MIIVHKIKYSLKQGFTLVEVLIALSIISVVLITLWKSLGHLIDQTATISAYQTAQYVAVQQLQLASLEMQPQGDKTYDCSVETFKLSCQLIIQPTKLIGELQTKPTNAAYNKQLITKTIKVMYQGQLLASQSMVVLQVGVQ